VGTAFLTMALGRRGKPGTAVTTQSAAAEAAQGDTVGDPMTSGT
jgi:hypothetical protein